MLLSSDRIATLIAADPNRPTILLAQPSPDAPKLQAARQAEEPRHAKAKQPRTARLSKGSASDDR